MRLLKRGVRGRDVLLWQRFVNQLRNDRTQRFAAPPLREDAIYGRGTAAATRAFQSQYKLNVDGRVGRDTYKKALELGFLKSGAPGTADLGPYVAQLRSGPPPPPVPTPEPATTAPPPSSGNSSRESFARLRAEAWKGSKDVLDALKEGSAHFQLLKDGDGTYVYDEYMGVVERMPADLTPEAFLAEMLNDLNKTVHNPDFDTINEFARRSSNPPKLGEIIDINIQGPDNGSVALVEFKPNYFVFQTVDCDKTGSHPENGAREFGFERGDGGVRFYTRGISRPSNIGVRYVGAGPQKTGWTALINGILRAIHDRGGKAQIGAVNIYKEERQE